MAQASPGGAEGAAAEFAALDCRVARFDAAGDCAAYNATPATFAANVAAARVAFLNLPTLARRARLSFHSSEAQTVAPYVAIVLNAPDDATANRALSSVFFSAGAELGGGGRSLTGGINVLILSKDNPTQVIEVDGFERIDAVAIYGGTAAGSAALEVTLC